MTREEAIDLLDNLIGMIEDNQGNDYDFALKKGIEALKQEPCEDYVSRQAVHDGMVKYGFHASDMTITEFVEDVLSPVTPTRKKGEWEEHPHEWGDNWQYSDYECSICHSSSHFDTDYCPHCGAEMESEE